MVLRSLYELYDRLASDSSYDIAAPGRSYQKVTFVVVLEPDGSLAGIEDARVPAGSRPVPKRVLVLGATKPSGSGLNPCFLWDAPGYLLGWDARPERAERALETFAAFRRRHLEVEHQVGNPWFRAVCRFLEKWDPKRAKDFPLLEEVATGFGVFQIRGEASYVHQHPGIQAWWDRRTAAEPERMKEWWQTRAPGTQSDPKGQCLVTGEDAPIARTHPKIKGVAGAQTSGATIAGFNDSAYWSYGLEQSYNAPVGVEAARRYTAALNALLEGPQRDKHRIVVGDTTVAFWTEKPSVVEDVFAAFAANGSDAVASAQDDVVRAKLEAFLRAVRQGRRAYDALGDDPDATRFFILGLAAPTPARVAGRFFHRGTLAELVSCLHRHHRDIGIERQWREDSKRPDPEFPPSRLLLAQTARESKDIPPVLEAPLLQAIVTGARYPTGLYQAVIRRITADRVINYPRACVIKGYLVRNLGKEVPMSLDTSRPEPAYRLGRLFAVLEKTQADAQGSGLNATIRDRFYSSASAMPAAVFPRLLRTYQHHLAKLDGGWKVVREKLVQEILDPIERFPAHLDLAEQGLFALGYYHQMNDLFRSKEDKVGNATEGN